MGLLDVLSAADLQYKLIGLAFVVAGLALFTGTAVLVRKRWWCTHGRIAAVAAGVAGALVGIYLLVMQYRAPGLAPSRLPPLPAWVPWAGIVAASVAGVVLGWWSTREYVDSQVKWTALGTRLAAGGLSVTVLFAGVQWWYTQQYQPGTIAAALTVTTELTPASSEGDRSDPHQFEGTIRIENVSDTKVQIVASLYQVTKVTQTARPEIPGVNAVDAERQAVACFLEELAPVTDRECDEPGIREFGGFSSGDPQAQDDWPISRTGRATAVQTLQMGQILGDRSWLEPKEEYQTNVLIHVPEEQAVAGGPFELDTLEMWAWLAVAQGSRLVLQPVPSHSPEMVPQALMSNEEYRDYTQARTDVQAPEREARGSARDSDEVVQETEEVGLGEREALLQELAVSRPQDETAFGVSEPVQTPRFYPHRYTVVEWPIEDLSTVHRLVTGSQVVNAVQVLSMRTYDPLVPAAVLADPSSSALMEYESAGMATCISPARTLEGEDADSEIRRDPTAVCPGTWYSLLDQDGDVANDYERRYQETVDYREEMAGYYGLIQTAAADVLSLTTADEAAAATMPAADYAHPVTSPAFETCEAALEWADVLMSFYVDNPQGAFDMRGAFARHEAEMRGLDDVPDGPSLADGVTAADGLDGYVDSTESVLADCSGTEVPEGTPAAACTQAADAWLGGLRYARDLGGAMREHLAVMQRLDRREITPQQARVQGEPSLDRGAAASSGYDQAVAGARERVEQCR
ncbi:hypothetical protein SAMN06273567_10913 [Geodermatophilus aquaeductus]|uniref:Uncharacterized protein n=1 Tax=Geodermatophilus aquaeductus TaxID=1564161 RepID=A0A521FJ17_9ACTN|nr:hypothetical protein [Geodermatophilus aquaeductus]SMO95580.1 hypothetical protein SAMN06273567_10913 [Geodermatophilus aquaeductus]